MVITLNPSAHFIIGLRLLLTASVILLPQRAALGVEVPCDYDSNAEWPWTSERMCQASPQPEALLADDSSNSIVICLLDSSDPDGDGWGWENHKSCKVSAAVPVAPSVTPSVTAPSGFPTCLNAGSDPDNDGWGWENNRSCVAKKSDNNNNNNNTPTSSAPAFATCSHSSSDPDGDGWGYENGASCIVSATTSSTVTNTAPANNTPQTETKAPIETKVDLTQNPAEIIFQQNFNDTALGSYNGAALNADWATPVWHMGFNQGRVHITEESGRGNAMRVTFPAHKYGAAGATAFLTDVEFGLGLPKSYDELYISYDVKFAKGFDFVKGGKLPGLCGYDNTQTPTSGCNTGGGFPDGYDGWSTRGMWRTDGELENYVYHAAQSSYYGDDEYWGAKPIPGQWHTIQHRVVLNTVGEANGILEAWFDGKKVLSKNDFIYRKNNQIGINLFYFSTFYGGNDPSWAPSEDQFLYFDNIRISTESNNDLQAKGLIFNDTPSSALTTDTNSGGGGFGTLFLFLFFTAQQLRRSSFKAIIS